MSNLVALKKNIADPRVTQQFKYALPSHIDTEKFQRVAITALNNNTDIANCTVDSVMTSLMKCAADGLLPDGKEAALVKYGNVCQYLPMVYGLIKKMRNSGEVSTVNAHLVHEHDEFEFEIINGEEIFRHKPKFMGDRGQMILAYCVVSMKDGTRHIETMPKVEVDAVRASSKAKDGPAWKNWYGEMAKKSVIHRAAKRVPTSADIEELIKRDVKVMMNGTDDEAEPTPSLIDNINQAIDAEYSDVPTDGLTELIGPVKDPVPFPGDQPSK